MFCIPMVCSVVRRAPLQHSPARSPTIFRPLLLLMLSALLLTVPGTTAQNPTGPLYEIEATVTPYDKTVPPVITSGNATLDISVTCTLPLVMVEHQNISLRMDSNMEGTTVHLDKTTLSIDRTACLTLGTAYDTEVVATFSFPSTAPAFENVEFRVHADHDGEEQQIARWNETPGFYANYEIHTEKVLVYTKVNETSNLEGTISSRSNGPMQVEFRLHASPRHGVLELPDRLEIPYDAEEANPPTPFLMEYTRESPGTDDLTILVNGISTQDPSQELRSSRIQLRFIEPQSNLAENLEDLPPPSLPLLAAAVMGLLLLIRRTR